MNPKGLLFSWLFLLAAALPAQEGKKIAAFVDNITDRGLTRILYWNNVTNGAAGEVAIDFGRPQWKPEYDAAGALEGMTKGKTWRMGKDLWTTLDTNLPLKIGSQSIAPGSYYLGVHRTADGATWSLAFIDPVKTRSNKLDAFEIDKATAAFKVPLTFKTTTETAALLNISLTPAQEDIKNVTLRLTWGKFELTTPVQVLLEN